MRAKWYNIGLQLGVSVGTLNAFKEQSNKPSECLRETLTTWLKSYPPPPMWTSIIDALRSSAIGETRLATDLEYKYCSTQDNSAAATHYHALPVPAMPQLQAPTLMTPPPQSTPPLTQPQLHPSCFPPWPIPYNYPPPTSYPMSTSLLYPPTSGVASAAASPTVDSQLSDPTPSLVPNPSLPTCMTASPQCAVLPLSPSSFITGDSTPPDTPPTSTVTISPPILASEYTDMNLGTRA